MTMLNLDELRFSSEKLNVSSLNNQNKVLTMNNLVYELFKELIGFLNIIILKTTMFLLQQINIFKKIKIKYVILF